MEMDEVVHMVGGSGEDSYAANSIVQRQGMMKSVAVLTAAIQEMGSTNQLEEEETIAVADLGCSSSPNTLLLLRSVALAVSSCCRQANGRLPDVQFFFNDLPGNDFNTLFRFTTPFLKELHDGEETGIVDKRSTRVAPGYVAGVPGSFYGRIFPKNSIHLVHSSHGVHFLSQVPQVLQTDSGARLNKRNIYLSKTSSPLVVASYADQFKKDFFLFLRSRAEELKVGGRMVLLCLGRDDPDPANEPWCGLPDALAAALSDMVSEGLVEEASLETFNIPVYSSSLTEMRDAIHSEGSFSLKSEDIFKVNWDSFEGDSEMDDVAIGKYVAKFVRAAMEPMLANHFKRVNMDVVFDKFAEKIAGVPREERFTFNLMVHLEKVIRR